MEAFQCNVLAAVFAIAIFRAGHPGQGSLQPPDLRCAARGLRLGHGLHLQCVHPRQPPDHLLVQLDHRLAVFSQAVLIGKFLQPGKDLRFQILLIGLIHAANIRHHGFAFAEKKLRWQS